MDEIVELRAEADGDEIAQHEEIGPQKCHEEDPPTRADCLVED